MVPIPLPPPPFRYLPLLAPGSSNTIQASYNMLFQLPAGLTCDGSSARCVLQWCARANAHGHGRPQPSLLRTHTACRALPLPPSSTPAQALDNWQLVHAPRHACQIRCIHVGGLRGEYCIP